MADWPFRVLVASSILFIAWELLVGRAVSRIPHGPSAWVSRQKNPETFWLYMTVQSIFAALLAYFAFVG